MNDRRAFRLRKALQNPAYRPAGNSLSGGRTMTAHADQDMLETYAGQVTAALSGTDARATRAAFAGIRRDDFLPSPPWMVAGGRRWRGSRYVSTCDPADIHDDVLVAIAPERRINNGQPSLWAGMMALVGGRDHVRSVLHSGAGLGYYTAVLARLFPDAAVEFDEGETDLFEQARRNLAAFANVRPRGESTVHDAIFLSYGICRIPRGLVKAMADGCQMVAPVTDRYGQGRVVHFPRSGDVLKAMPAMAVSFITDSTVADFPETMLPRERTIAIGDGDIDLGAAFAVGS